MLWLLSTGSEVLTAKIGNVCFPWPPAGTSTLSSASSKRDPSKAGDDETEES